MQITNSSVTLNPMPETGYNSSKSIKAWMPTVFPTEFELKYFVDRYNLNSSFQYPNMTQALKTWYWDNFFAPQMLTVALANNYQGNYTFMQTRMGFGDPNVFEKYINYLTLNVFLGGMTYTGRLGDMLLGFNPPVVNKLRTMPPLLGGDPSILTYINMNENNTYVFQTRFTGQQNLSQVGSFYSTNANRTVNMLSQYWDGSDTIRNSTVNPWANETYYQGGDSYFIPHSNQNNIEKGYVTDLYRSFSSVYSSKIQKNLGLKCLRFVADPKDAYCSSQIPANAAFYQDKYTGLLNYTKPRRAPVFLSKMLFHDANETVANNVVIQNTQGQTVTYTGDDMGGYVDLEPRTGIPVSLAVNFQINVDCSNDTLLGTRPDFMVPFFQLRRGLDLTDDQVQQIFGPMLSAFKWSKVVTIISSILSGLGIFFLVSLIVRNRELMSHQKEVGGDDEDVRYKKVKGGAGVEDESDFGMTVMKNNMVSVKTDPNSQKLSTKSLMM
jgi:CD36 family